MAILDTQSLQAVGWSGFLDFNYMLGALAALALAVALGALIAFHPTTQRGVDTLEEAELPKVYIMYALVGAMVGVIVLEYGLVVGFVVFGLGGLMRFRTDTANTRDTGRLIVVTLLGLISGLNLPHFAVLAAAFAWVLIYVFDGHPVCSIKVREVPKGRIKDAVAAYRLVLAEQGCKLISENKSFSKSKIELVFRMPRNLAQTALHDTLCANVPPDIRGELDWEVE
jgi:hypothetical protein